jgi:transketolase N-terminal domain/subunit
VRERAEVWHRAQNLVARIEENVFQLQGNEEFILNDQDLSPAHTHIPSENPAD